MPTPDQLWAELNHDLVTKKMLVPSRRMHEEIEETRKKSWAGLYPALIDAEIEISREYIEAVYDVHLEVWKLQGKALSQVFIRAVLDREIGRLIRIREGAIRGHLARQAGRTGACANWGAIQQKLIRDMNHLLTSWINRCEIEGDTLSTLLGLEMNELCATGDAAQRDARIARRSWELYKPAPEGTSPAKAVDESTPGAQNGRFSAMQIDREWVLALARFEAFRNNLPSRFDQQRVGEYHAHVDALGAASKDDLTSFRIPPAEMKREVVSVRRAPYGGGHGSIQYGDKLYCDAGFFKRQVDGLWNYVSKLSPRTDACPPTIEEIGRDATLGHGQFSAPPVVEPVAGRDGAADPGGEGAAAETGGAIQGPGDQASQEAVQTESQRSAEIVGETQPKPSRKVSWPHPEIAMRRAIVARNPEMESEGICVLFDESKVPLPRGMREAGTWAKAHKAATYRHAIHSLITRDRKKLGN
jgi:hypothetical protein